MHSPSSAAMRVRSTTTYPISPVKAPRRASSSEGLQRRLLDLYAKQRRLPFYLVRLPTFFAFLLVFLTASHLSWKLGRRGVAVGLRTISRFTSKMATAVDGVHPSLDVTADRVFRDDMMENKQVLSSNHYRYRRRRRNHAQTAKKLVGHHQGSGIAPSGHSSSYSSNHSGHRKVPIHAGTHPESQALRSLNYVTPRSVPADHVSRHAAFSEPKECGQWRRIARNLSAVHPYRKHFTSLDVTDWFLYVAVFNELFHKNAANRHRRPRYLDVAANHARRWSATWFFDRCMGWDGICAEANPKYYPELSNQRHCHLIPTCVSDVPRTVKFSMTDAYGGVVKDDSQRFGVNGHMHSHLAKFKGEFHGFQELKCTTMEAELSRLRMQRFDFMSLDVEGHELPILKGVDWSKTIIDVIVTENRTPQVQKLLERAGYVLHKNILKDFIYIRKGSGYTIGDEWIKAMKALDRRTYLFHI